jgi:hypothetical protein
MTPAVLRTRREFITSVGIALASLVMTRCISPDGSAASPRDRLRDCWLRLDWLAQETRKEGQIEPGERAQVRLSQEHQEALSECVAAGELSEAVADQVQAAFDAAAYHVWRSNAPITCYEPMMVDYKPASSGQLAQQAALLATMSEKGGLDPEVVARAQAAIERDIAFLNLSSTETQLLYERLVQASREGQGIPTFEELELEITPEAVQAAQFLVELLPGK